MSKLADICKGLPEPDLELLQRIEQGMPLTADLSRSDLLLLRLMNSGRLTVLVQAQPHSIASLYDAPLAGTTLDGAEMEPLLEAWRGRRHLRTQRQLHPSGAPVVQDVFPVRGAQGNVIALLSIEISSIQAERHHSRHKSFRQAVECLKAMCIRGELANAGDMSPFSEFDGVLLVDQQRRITYMSGIANNLYRRLGYLDDLRLKRLSYLNTKDDHLVSAALDQNAPLEAEQQEGSRIWIRKVLPVWPSAGLPDGRLGWLLSRRSRPGEIKWVVIMVHDATEERQKRQELKVKSTMIQEVHHRVKNNLQTIAAMLRMQARRTEDEDALQAINEATTRILSVAVIHEFLSRHETQSINVKDVCHRILTQSRQVAVAPGKEINLGLEGPNIYLPSQQATAIALVVNELVQNAVEHGFEHQKGGQIKVMLYDGPETVMLEVWDDGDSLPAEFDLTITNSLGLQIVRSLVQDDLHGSISLRNHDGQVVATVEFPKMALAKDNE